MKCQFYLSYVDAILVVCRCIQRNFFHAYFMRKWFFEKWKHRQVFLRNNDLNSLIFINKPPCFFGSRSFNILTDIFQRNENRFISLVLKAKQQKAIQLPYIFLKFYMNQFSNQFSFLHFAGLWNL